MNRIKIEYQSVNYWTLRKIYKGSWYRDALDSVSEQNQFMENLDNEFITEQALKIIINSVFNEKSSGKFPNSTKDMFGTRAKCRFVRDKLKELLNH